MSGPTSPLLVKGLEQLAIPHTPEQLGKLGIFLEELERWNRRYGLVSRRARNDQTGQTNQSGQTGAQELIVRHILDSLSAWALISSLDRRDQIADVGSGAGFPGIPLALFLPESHFTLVEPSARKTAFLRNVVVLAKLENVDIAEMRLQELPSRFDLVVFRAFSPISRELVALQRIVNPDGQIIAYKGKRGKILSELEDADLDPQAVRIQAVTVPFLQEERHLVIFSPSSSGA